MAETKSEKREAQLRHAEELVRRLIAEAVLFNYDVSERIGMSARDMQVLHLLQLEGPMPAGRLAELTRLTTGTVTGIIDRLESAGLARRGPDPADRRRVIVSLDAARVAEKLMPFYAGQGELLESTLRSCTGAERKVIIGFLERLVAGAVEQGARAPAEAEGTSPA